MNHIAKFSYHETIKPEFQSPRVQARLWALKKLREYFVKNSGLPCPAWEGMHILRWIEADLRRGGATSEYRLRDDIKGFDWRHNFSLVIGAGIEDYVFRDHPNKGFPLTAGVLPSALPGNPTSKDADPAKAQYGIRRERMWPEDILVSMLSAGTLANIRTHFPPLQSSATRQGVYSHFKKYLPEGGRAVGPIWDGQNAQRLVELTDDLTRPLAMTGHNPSCRNCWQPFDYISEWDNGIFCSDECEAAYHLMIDGPGIEMREEPEPKIKLTDEVLLASAYAQKPGAYRRKAQAKAEYKDIFFHIVYNEMRGKWVISTADPHDPTKPVQYVKKPGL